MTFWEAYCDSSWRAGYEVVLSAQGYSASQVSDISTRFAYYIGRMKGNKVGMDLAKIDNREDFEAKLDHIFNVLWVNNMGENYKDMPSHFKAYLKYLKSAQTARGIYINEMEKSCYGRPLQEMPQSQLTEYETEYLQDGKLKLLANPALLSYINRASSYQEGFNVNMIPMICANYYKETIPLMHMKDFIPLVKAIWTTGKITKIQGVRAGVSMKIIYPNGIENIRPLHKAIEDTILFYGPENVIQKKLQIQSRDFLVKRIPFGHDSEYECLVDGFYYCKIGNPESKIRLLNSLNTFFRRQLKIERIK